MKSVLAFSTILVGGLTGVFVGAAIAFTFIPSKHELWQLLFLFWGLGAGLWVGQKMAMRLTSQQSN